MHANIHIDGSVVRTVILEQIDSEHQLAATQEYEVQLKATGDSTMSASGLYKVCTAAGWDIGTPEGKTKCDKFVNTLLEDATYTYYEVCGPDKGKSGGTERCIDNVFYALINGIDVQIGQAIELSKEYAVVKFNDDIECSSGTRKGTINPKNDYVKCTSKLTPTYYEFKFDDVNQSTNTPIYKDTIRAVGNIHGVSFKDSGCSLERIMNDTACTVGYETTDHVVCDKLSKSLGRFGMKAEVRNVTGASLNDVERFCAVSFTTNKCTAAKEYGIDDTTFKEIQYPLSPTLENYVKDYVFEQLKAKNIYPKSFSCDKMPVRGDQVVAGLHVANGYTLNCHIDDKCIGFVFEDLSESANYSKNAALSRLACIKHGGISNGENCRGLDEKQCAALGEKTKNSGKFMGTHYDRVRGGCILNGAVAESQINLLGEIAAGVAITLVTDGALLIPVAVSIGTDLAFDAVNDWQRKIPYNDYQEFIAHVMDCVEDKKSGLQDAIRISKINSVENKYCLSETIRKDYQLVVGQMDKLAPEDQRILSEVFANIIDNIGDTEYIRKASESDISLIKKSRNFAQGALLAGIILVHPEKMLSKFDDVARDVARLRYGASKNFTQHLDDFRTIGKNTALPMARLSKTEWQLLNKSLAIDGIELVEKDGYMIFKRLVPFENSGIKNFLTKFKYNLDIPTSSYQDVLKKWNLPADATDDVIEAHYKMLKTEVDLIPDNGMSEVGELKAALLSDYDVIKRTKPNYLRPKNIVPSVLDNSDEAGRIRIQAMKEKYGIKFQDGASGIVLPNGIGDIMRKELGNSNVEKQFYEDVRGFLYEYHGVVGNPVDIGDFRGLDELKPGSALSTERTTALREEFGLTSKTTPPTSGTTTSQTDYNFNMGNKTTMTTQEPKAASTTQETKPTVLSEQNTSTPKPNSSQAINTAKTVEKQMNSLVDELWNEARYNATRPASDGFESLAEKFGILRDFGGYYPDGMDETYKILTRIQDQLDDTERVLRIHQNDFDGIDDYERLWYNFNKDKDMAEQYIEWLRTHLEYLVLPNHI